MTDMQKAVCWELGTSSEAVTGMRVLLAGHFVGQQMLTAANQRPRWAFTSFSDAEAAASAAVAVTETFEKEWHGTLIVPPGEIALHPSEFDAMGTQRPISPALRARIFTSLQRRDPRVNGGAAHATAT